MPVTIRLTRTGRKKVATYRVVVADSRFSRDGRFLESLGTYEPQATPKKFNLKTDRIEHWIKKGAVPSETVANLLKQDNHGKKVDAVAKGLPADSVTRLPERKRKSKPKAKKAAAAS